MLTLKPMPLIGFPLGPKRLPCVKCGAENCTNSTKEGKPYCQEHIHLNPYVVEILKNMKKIEKEKKLALTKRRVVKNGFLETDFFNLLKERGPTVIETLAKLSGYKLAIIKVYVAAAYKKGLVKLEKTKRGYTRVALLAESN